MSNTYQIYLISDSTGETVDHVARACLAQFEEFVPTQHVWTMVRSPKQVEKFLEDELAYSCFPIRNGLHIERRPGGVNFSILGRGKDTFNGREEYVKWDKERLERVDIAERLKTQFPDLEVQVGGQTGLDLAPKGSNKSQILRDFDKTDDLHFFGDMMEEGQNDYPLAMAILDNMMGTCYNVNDYKETQKLLLNI